MSVNRLVDFPYVLVRIRCDVCKRSGAYKLAMLAAKFGSEVHLEDLLAKLSLDCAWREDPRAPHPGARFADLPMVRPPDMPSRRMRVIKGGKN